MAYAEYNSWVYIREGSGCIASRNVANDVKRLPAIASRRKMHGDGDGAGGEREEISRPRSK